jgi:hypothetical protein
MPLYLTYLNNHDGIISKLCMALNLIFISIVWIWAISCNYVIIMWESYAQRAKGSNVKACYEFGNDLMKIMCFKHEVKMQINDIIMINCV